MKSTLVVTFAAAMILAGITTQAPATAAEQRMHPDVAYALSAVPGGSVIDSHTVVWPDLNMTLSVVVPFSRAAVGSCASGQFCAYSGANLSGSKLTWSGCTEVSTAALSKVGSIANARSSGIVRAHSAAGVTLASASAGKSAKVVGAATTLRCTS
ncbi:peptidase inhibitor family I36 protein [Microbacterium sp. NPDC097977]|uniref:peptidase inhibitor family I36 protein n=1 Tax=Microbacterium sp. NPDC097977 TaxID=3155686 RepID=UPI00331E0C00